MWPTETGAFVAVTRLGVEYHDGVEGSLFRRVARWSVPLARNEGVEVGFTAARSILVVTPVAMASNGI